MCRGHVPMCSGKVPIFTDPLGRPVSSSIFEWPSSKVSKESPSLSILAKPLEKVTISPISPNWSPILTGLLHAEGFKDHLDSWPLPWNEIQQSNTPPKFRVFSKKSSQNIHVYTTLQMLPITVYQFDTFCAVDEFSQCIPQTYDIIHSIEMYRNLNIEDKKKLFPSACVSGKGGDAP